MQQLATTLGLVPAELVRLAQIHDVLTHSAVGPAALAVLPEMVWYEEALAAPEPATALAYALDQVAAGRLYRPSDVRRDVQKVVAARGRRGPLGPPSPQVRLRVQRRDGSLWPAAEAVAFDVGDVAAITMETPQGRLVVGSIARATLSWTNCRRRDAACARRVQGSSDGLATTGTLERGTRRGTGPRKSAAILALSRGVPAAWRPTA